MTMGQKIKELRKQLNMSVDDLAAKLGKNRATVYRYERGDIENLHLDVLEPLAKALNTTPGYLMGWETNKKKITNPDQATIGDILRVLRLQRRVSVEEFSEELGVTPDDLGMYEDGSKQIPVGLIKAIADYYGFTISELIGVDSIKDAEGSLYITRNKRIAYRFEKWNKEFHDAEFTDDELEKIFDYAKFLIASRK